MAILKYYDAITSTWKKVDLAIPANPFLDAHPVGSIFMTVTSTNPGDTYGGTWSLWGAGKVPVGVDTGDTDFDTVEETGGAKTVAGAAHTHNLSANGQAQVAQGSSGTIETRRVAAASWVSTHKLTATNNTAGASIVLGSALTGNTDSATPSATSVLQPYITCYMWKRTA